MDLEIFTILISNVLQQWNVMWVKSGTKTLWEANMLSHSKAAAW